MHEIRVDPLTGLRAIVATEPTGAELRVDPPAPIDPAADPFAEGSERRTAPELHAERPGGGAANGPGWTVRVLPAAPAALAAAAPAPEPDARPELYTAVAAAGAHELIVNSPRSVGALAELSVGELGAAVEVWRARMRCHDGASYVHVCVDERAAPGGAPAHTHAQLYALRFVPALVARERERYGAYATRTMGGDLLEDLVAEEVRRRRRIVAIDDEAVLWCPYAARREYALALAPRRRRPRFEDQGASAAALLHDALGRLRRRFGADPPLALWVRTAPRGAERFCWRIEIVPRLVRAGGLQLGGGVELNGVAPERAAAELRDA